MEDILNEHLDTATSEKKQPKKTWTHILLRTVIVGLIVCVITVAGFYFREYIPAMDAWVKQQGVYAPIAYIGIFIVAVVILIPADILIFTAGAIFGLWWGVLYIAIAEYLAMMLQYYIARILIKKKVEHFLSYHPKFNAIDRAVSKEGLKIAFLLRLGPVPFGPLSYILSVSRINFSTYMLASIGTFPSLIAVVYYGNMAAKFTRLAAGIDHNSTTHYVMMGVGGLIAIAATVYIARIAKKALSKAADIKS